MEENNRSLVPVMVLSCLEAAINTLVSGDRHLLASFANFAGKVVRVKTTAPEISLYILFCTDGIQILSQFDGHVDARVRAPASTLILYLLSPDSELDEERLNQGIVISGNRALLEALNQLANELNIWHLLHQLLLSWIPDPLSLTDLLEALHRADPVWIEKLQALLLSMEGVKQQLMQQAVLQQQQLDALLDIRRVLHLQQLRMQLMGAIGVIIMVIGLLGTNHILPVSEIIERVGALNLALIFGGFCMALLGTASLGRSLLTSSSGSVVRKDRAVSIKGFN